MKDDVGTLDRCAQSSMVLKPAVDSTRAGREWPPARGTGTPNAQDVIPTRDQRVDEMAADESRASGDHGAHAQAAP